MTAEQELFNYRRLGEVMDKETKTSVVCISITLFLIFGIPLIGYYIIFCPHTYYGIFIDKEQVCDEYAITLEKGERIVSYYDNSFLIAIHTEAVIETDEPQEFLKRNKYDDSETIRRHFEVAEIVPRGTIYRIKLAHFE